MHPAFLVAKWVLDLPSLQIFPPIFTAFWLGTAKHDYCGIPLFVDSNEATDIGRAIIEGFDVGDA
mgnify:FL=1